MKRKTVLSVLAAGLLTAAAFAQEPLPDIFNRMKSEFGKGEYKSSLADVEKLNELTQKPGLENDRSKLAAPLSFYRAANLASLGRRDEAREEFLTFLLLSPNASITSPPFAKPVVDAFDQARKLAAGRNNSIGVTYAAFTVPAGWSLPADAAWTLSPVRYLLSNEEKKSYATMSDADRKAFVERFWAAYDPTPDTPANEFRSEFERRVAFADKNFATAKMTGRETDRALVFVFLGPPTFASSAPLGANDDAVSVLRGAGSGSSVTGGSYRGMGTMSAGGPVGAPLETPDARGMREAWTYRAGRIPPHVPFQELKFAFLTKEGYGDGVLQKDPNILQSIGIATDNARTGKKLN